LIRWTKSAGFFFLAGLNPWTPHTVGVFRGFNPLEIKSVIKSSGVWSPIPYDVFAFIIVIDVRLQMLTEEIIFPFSVTSIGFVYFFVFILSANNTFSRTSGVPSILNLPVARRCVYRCSLFQLDTFFHFIDSFLERAEKSHGKISIKPQEKPANSMTNISVAGHLTSSDV